MFVVINSPAQNKGTGKQTNLAKKPCCDDILKNQINKISVMPPPSLCGATGCEEVRALLREWTETVAGTKTHIKYSLRYNLPCYTSFCLYVVDESANIFYY